MTQTRNHKMDNVKTLLIFLVVLGHLADFYVNQSTNMQFLYSYIYIFHMSVIYIMHHFKIEELLVDVTQYHWLKLYNLLSVPLTLLLAIKPLGWPFKKIIELDYSKILDRRSN